MRPSWVTQGSVSDQLLRRSFQAGGPPAHAQLGGRSRCPWVTAGDLCFPLVLARKWHGACWSSALETVDGIVDLVSSKTARLRRRQAAQRKRYKRLRKSGRVPQHTQAERRRAEAERQLQREADQRRQARLRRMTVPLAASTGAAAITFMTTPAVSKWHSLYPYVSAAAGLAWPESPELPHTPEPDMTFYSPLVAAGTAATFVRVGPMRSETWDGSERYGRYGLNIFGD